MDPLYLVPGALLLLLHLWAIAQVLRSGVSRGMKLLWLSLLVLFPLLGVFNWWIMGPRAVGVPPR